ncbi:MAG: hypothetical protein COT43_04405 [Candidatus Marinimicrobia bacterium CG08_land_8_20_14_0_20_45_22]|nr:MAG: hypothetical protein COT43_04405 [Candidatus Marinimicrobia bacterium CG08_land_8_20_14_0_20_45_22]
MKKLNLIAMLALSALVILVTIPTQINAQTPTGHGKNFVDVNGDGHNDNAPDADGDGIPNGQDPDYVALGTASGRGTSRKFVDADGDGFNDNAPDIDGDGIPNGQDSDYQRPSNGTGKTSGKGQHGNGKYSPATGTTPGAGAGMGTKRQARQGVINTK